MSPSVPPASVPSVHALTQAIRDKETRSIPQLLVRHLASAPATRKGAAIWRAAISVCFNANDTQSAAAVLHAGLASRVASSLSVAYFVAPLRQLAFAAQWPAVFSLLDDMCRVGGRVSPDERLFVGLANLAVERRAYDVSLRMFSLMRRQRIKMGPVSFSVLLKSHGRAGNVVAVKRVLNDMKRLSIELDSILLNSVIDALERCNDLTAAQNFLLDASYESLKDVVTYNILIKGFAVRGMLVEAFDIVKNMKTNGVQPNDITRNTLLSACVQAGDFDQAWQLVEEMSDSKADSSIYNGNALSITSASPLSMQRTIAITSVLQGLIEVDRINEALALLADMPRRHAPPSHITYAAFITSCFRQGAINEAKSVFKSIPQSNSENSYQTLRTLSVYNAYVNGLCRVDELALVEEAATVVEGMISESSSDAVCVYPDVDTFNMLLEGFVGCSAYDRAEHFLTFMEAKGIKPDIVSLTIMMKGFMKSRQFGRANRMFREISIRGLKPDRIALNVFLAVCVRSGDRKSALRVLDYMERNDTGLSPCAQSYTPLISACMYSGADDELWQMYNRMRINGIPVSNYLMEYLGTYIVDRSRGSKKRVVKRNGPHVDLEDFAVRGAKLLRDGQDDGVSARVLRKYRRKMLGVFTDERLRNHFRGLDSPELISASEKIFDKHGWNEIDSGWRVL